MDRLAITVIALGLVMCIAGLARGRDALTVRGQAAAMEARVATAHRDLDRLRAIPADAQILPAITHTLVLLDRGVFATPTPLQVRAQLDPGSRNENLWAPLTGEALKITMQTDASPMAAVDWLDLALRQHALLLTKIHWDGRTGTVNAVALGP